jgi:hypothetical protein
MKKGGADIRASLSYHAKGGGIPVDVYNELGWYAWAKLEVENDPILGEVLVAGGVTKWYGVYIARITGLDPNYRYRREFLGETYYDSKKHRATVMVPVRELQEGDILEIRCGGSRKREYRGFFMWENRNVRAITEKELRAALAAKLSKEQQDDN